MTDLSGRRAAAALAAVLLALAGCGGDDDSGEPDEPTTTPPTTTAAPTTAPSSTTTVAPTTTVVEATADPTTTAPATTEPATTSSSEAPAAAVVPTVWFGPRLLGYFDGERFVGNPGIDGVPDGLLGATIDLRDPAGDTATAVVVAGCYEAELDFGAERDLALWYSPDAPLVLAGPDTSDGEDEMIADLAAMGIDPASAVSYGNDFTADGSVDRLVLVDGWNVPFQWPTWIATWDADTGEFTTVEGDTDPSASLDIGRPLQPWLDTDRDGNLEVAFAVGDAYVLHELGMGESIAVGAVVSC